MPSDVVHPGYLLRDECMGSSIHTLQAEVQVVCYPVTNILCCLRGADIPLRKILISRFIGEGNHRQQKLQQRGISSQNQDTKQRLMHQREEIRTSRNQSNIRPRRSEKRPKRQSLCLGPSHRQHHRIPTTPAQYETIESTCP